LAPIDEVNLANVLDEGLRIEGRRHWMNSKVKINQTWRGLVCIENKRGTQLAQSQSVPGRPLLAPIYRWPCLEDLVGFDTNYNICIRHQLIFDYIYALDSLIGPGGTKIMGSVSYTLVTYRHLLVSRTPTLHRQE
jgi:hypothetical protein